MNSIIGVYIIIGGDSYLGCIDKSPSIQESEAVFVTMMEACLVSLPVNNIINLKDTIISIIFVVIIIIIFLITFVEIIIITILIIFIIIFTAIIIIIKIFSNILPLSSSSQ